MKYLTYPVPNPYIYEQLRDHNGVITHNLLCQTLSIHRTVKIIHSHPHPNPFNILTVENYS